MLVSVIIPTFNRSKYLGEAIDGVLAQTYKNLEIIVVDGGSTDNTPEVVKKYGDKIKYFYLSKQGVIPARNYGFNQSRGEYIAFLDDDDMWVNDKIEKQISILTEDPRLGFVCSPVYIVDERGTRVGLRESHEPCTFAALYETWFVEISTILIRRECLMSVGLFDESVLGSECYDLWLRLAKQYPFDYINEPLAKSRVHHTNASRNWDIVLKSRIRVVNKREITYDMSFLKRRIRTAKVYYEFGTLYARERKYHPAFINYIKAVATFPWVGMYYWPAESKKFRFSLPYRIIKSYFLLVELLIKSAIEQVHMRFHLRFK